MRHDTSPTPGPGPFPSLARLRSRKRSVMASSLAVEPVGGWSIVCRLQLPSLGRSASRALETMSSVAERTSASLGVAPETDAR